MTGYQEAVTDPSYAGQIITFTYPLIGNYGVSAAGDGVRPRPRARRDHARGQERRGRRRRRGRLARLARATAASRRSPASTRARSCATSATGARCAAASSPPRSPRPRRASGSPPSRRWRAPTSPRTVTPDEPIELDGDGPHVVGIDTGIKLCIIRQLRERGCRLTLLPCDAVRRATVLAREPDLVFLANGPGDPAALDYVVDTVRELVGKQPVVGICLGHQLLCRAVGLETFKLPFGHRGANHPVKDLETRQDRHHLPEPRLRRRGPERRARRSRATSRSAGRPTSAPPSSPT